MFEDNMQQQYRLRKNSQFQYVYRKGKGFGAKEISLIFVPSRQKLVGFSVGKKVGNAVTRNRVKRRLRAAFIGELPKVGPGLYIVAARSAAADASFQDLRRSLQYLLKKHRAYAIQS